MSLDEAHRKFCDNPLLYQEDFMWMGSRAFTFYFPVIDRFVRSSFESSASELPDDIGFIASCISMQISEEGDAFSAELVEEIRQLAETVIRKVGRCDDFESSVLTSRQSFVLEWQHLLKTLSSG